LNNSFSLQDIIKVVWKNVLWLVAAMFVFGAFFGGYAKHKQNTIYTAKREMTIYHNYAKNSDDNKTDQSTILNSDMQMIETYSKVATDRSILLQAQKNMKKHHQYKVSTSEIKNMVEVTAEPQTVVLNVSAKSGSSKKAVAVVNATTIAIEEKLPKLLNNVGHISVMSAAKTDTVQSTTGPSAKKYAMLGVAVGFLVSFVVIFTRETIKMGNDKNR
jgi:capsular polysaccharide biosynthesis protein